MTHSITVALVSAGPARRSLRLDGKEWWAIYEPEPGRQAERGPYTSSTEALAALADMEKELKT